MLAKPPTVEPTMSLACAGNYVVRLAMGINCPHCPRQLYATDVDVDFGDVRLICRGCHKDVLVIRAAQ